MSPKTIFIFAYYSYHDPVFQSAVLPYFLNFPEKEKFRFVLLTFEQEKYKTSKEERKKISDFLTTHHIHWYNTQWHSGRFKLLKKAFDFSWGMLLSIFLILRFRASIIYSEAFPGAIITHLISILTFRKHIVHTFEPHADYQIESGLWNVNSWETQLLKWFEPRIARRCTAIFTATQAMIERLQATGTQAQLHRVPSCVDLQTFFFSSDARVEIRKNLQIDQTDIVLTYLGKFGGYYFEEELFDFFSICKTQSKRFKFFIFTPDAHEKIKEWAKKWNIDDILFIKTLSRSEVPAYLSASDWGISAIRPFPSKRLCSPIKDGEYWATELPIIIPENISDDYLFAQEENIGLVMNQLNKESYLDIAQQILSISEEKYQMMRKNARSFVVKDRNVAVYQKLYAEVFQTA